jgi:hypothetical protein
MYRTDAAEWPLQYTQLACPFFLTCHWTHIDAGPQGIAESTDREHVRRVMMRHVMSVESVVRAHLETHPLEEWLREVMRLRDDGYLTDQANRAIIASLVRQIGGTAVVGDNELRESPALCREPVMDGLRLTVNK